MARNILSVSGCALVLFISMLFLQPSLLQGSADLKVQVTVRTANIRFKPSLDSPVIGKATNGQVFKVIRKIDDWYSIELPPDREGRVLSGFIHQSVVREVREETPRPGPSIQPQPEKKEKAAPTQKQEQEAPAQPPPRLSREEVASTAASGKKFFVRLGGGYGSKSYNYGRSWNFDLYYEKGEITEDYRIDSSGPVFDVGIGFYFLKSLAVEVSFIPASGKTSGTFTASFPHPLYFDSARETNWDNPSLKYSASEINFNLLFSQPLSSRLSIYLTAGGTYFSGIKVENLKLVNWNENGYPYSDVSVTPQYSLYSKDTFGFNAGGGADFFITPTVGLNLNVRYSDGTAEMEVEGNKVSIKTGGIRATGGIKFAF
ncbi:MAG: outer membrane beta-barrel protein [Candidatus Aminicenantales bacterium]